MNRAIALFTLMLLTGCEPDPGAPYSPCETRDDCDPKVTDGCHTSPVGEGTCTLICQTASDCPAGPPGSGDPVCSPYKATKICELP